MATTRRRPHKKLSDIIGNKSPDVTEDHVLKLVDASNTSAAEHSADDQNEGDQAELAAGPDRTEPAEKGGQAGDQLEDDQAPAEAAPAPAAERPAQPPKKAPAARAPRTAPKTAQKATPPALAALEAMFSEGDPVVLATDVDGAERVNLYLHPDDKALLDLAKINDRADLNSRFRAMLAVYRSNKRYRGMVDKLARTAPRGGGR